VSWETTRDPADFYRGIFRGDLERQAEWSRRGAPQKVNSIRILLEERSIAPRSLLELGCGTGAVISECRRRGIGERHLAIDISDEAIGYLREHSEGIDARISRSRDFVSRNGAICSS
jgi:methylase of polypeptide subunit release factors